MKPFQAALPFLAMALLAGSQAWAGEIVIGPEKADVRNPGARSQRERAGAYQKGTEAIVVPEEEDGGFLSPRGGAPAEERAYGNRSRARAYQQGMDPSAGQPGMPGGLGDIPIPLTSQERAQDLRSRARTYSGNGNAQDIDLSHVGSDGIPIVPCRSDVDNSAARIGEDGVSGSLFYIMRNGKPVKVRCK